MRAPFAALTALLGLLAPGTAAAAPGTGGASPDVPTPRAAGALAFGAPGRPVARLFRVSPGSVVEGRAPAALRLRIDLDGERRVRARVVVWDPRAHRATARLDLGAVRTGAVVRRRWPRGTRLPVGEHLVRLHVTAPGGRTLLRSHDATGKAALTVTPRPAPAPAPAPPAPAPAPPAPAPAPAAGRAFPVAGPHTLGGADAAFGARRTGHAHEGQDVLAAEGTPVVAVMPGVVTSTAFQAGGAGEYVVVHHDDGRATMSAHCVRGSTAVAVGARVAAGTRLCAVGTTGASTGPHLHFELWEGGWRDRGGRPVDPLPFLRSLG
jgi:biotin carboxyl carrier protein